MWTRVLLFSQYHLLPCPTQNNVKYVTIRRYYKLDGVRGGLQVRSEGTKVSTRLCLLGVVGGVTLGVVGGVTLPYRSIGLLLDLKNHYQFTVKRTRQDPISYVQDVVVFGVVSFGGREVSFSRPQNGRFFFSCLDRIRILSSTLTFTSH